MTPYGSFWTNSLSDIALPKDVRNMNIPIHGRCFTEGFESVALIPLKSDEKIIGLLQFNDRRKGILNLERIQFFEGIGASIGISLSRKLAEEALLVSEERLRQRNEVIESDLRLAQMIQTKFINQVTPSHPRLLTDYRYFPHDAVGGDYFSFTKLQEGGMGIFIGDVVGHGISAALFLSLLKAATDRVCRQHGLRPGEYLKALNMELIEYMNFNFITAIYGLFQFDDDGSKASFIFSNGGHPKPILYRRTTRTAELLHASGTFLGVFHDIEFDEISVQVQHGDRIFLYTDGIPETRDDRGRIIGFDELASLIQRVNKPKLTDTLDSIINEVNKHRETDPFQDDIILIGIEIL
jgi:phosphoserine phosphatase RsbU/P